MGRKMFKIFLIQLFIIILIFSFFYYNNTDHKLGLKSKLKTTNMSEKFKKSFTISTNIYEELENALLGGEENVIIKNSMKYKNPSNIFEVLEKISLDNPKVMYYTGVNYSIGNLVISYSMSKEDIKKHQNEIQRIGEKFLKENITSTMSDYEKILKSHDYIILNSRYDERLKRDGFVPPESNSSYGVLSLGVGVCEGYAKALKHLLDILDIESMVVVGTSREENHAWNLVNIEGDYYHVDPTWNDPITSDGSDIIRHNYFNLSDEEISKTHSWNREKYPIANSDKYNYFTYNNLVVEDLDELIIKLRESLLVKKDNLLVKVIDYDIKGIRIDEIINSVIYDYREQINLKSYTYSLDVEQGIISFEFSYH